MATPFPAAPPGTFVPGTKVQVGSHKVVIQRYLSEGGFAHVYVVTYPSPTGKAAENAVLKRVAVPDKDALANMRTEVETMKKLKGHKHIVTYIDSHASQLKNGGYEVFLLMEWCQGGGLIDFMNTRLKNRLTESEILQIFGDTAEGLACMHYLKPPLLHRDLKIENILISKDGGERLYKLCDFGSSAPPRPAATSAAEGKLIEDDVQRHTTMQYRSPEMIDVYRNRPIDEKSDIWALGVMLYKLCYYVTPFEEKGQMAILTASYKYPAYPQFSDRLKLLIAKMLTEEPRKRPNIYEVLSEVCSIRGKSMPIKDIYANRTASEARDMQKMPPREVDIQSPPMLGATIVAPKRETQKIPDIAPMRRGRPISTTATDHTPKNTSQSKAVSKDPFAALDSSNYDTRAKAVDELAGKFPALEDFAILQGSASSKYKFDSKSPTAPLHTRVTNALADEAFGNLRDSGPSAKSVGPGKQTIQDRRDIPTPAKPSGHATLGQSRASPSVEITSGKPLEKPLPIRPSVMISTGTSTDDLPPPKPPRPAESDVREKPIWRVPIISKSPRLPELGQTDDMIHEKGLAMRSTQSHLLRGQPRSPSLSRASLESARPSSLVVKDPLARSHSANSRADPELDERAERRIGLRPEHKRSRSQQLLNLAGTRHEESADNSHLDVEHQTPHDDTAVIDDNVEYLRVMEEQDQGSHRRSSSKLKQHFRNASMTAVPKGIFSGRGRKSDTLKRFDGSKSPAAESSIHRDSYMDMPPTADSPILPDQEDALEVVEDLSPEMRRELERRRLSQEERRVAEAAAAYRERINRGGPSSVGRATAIQDRVRNLLDESGKQPVVKRTAVGYGQYTSAPDDAQPVKNSSWQQQINTASQAPQATGAPPQGMPTRARTIAEGPGVAARTGAAARPVRPSAPPKPIGLRTAGTSSPQLARDFGSGDEEDWEKSFASRYPSISLDNIETNIT